MLLRLNTVLPTVRSSINYRNMSTLSHLSSAINTLTPLSLAETSWDNVGLMVEPPKPRHTSQGSKRSVYLCIDRKLLHFSLAYPAIC
jgi:hypothetical protein